MTSVVRVSVAWVLFGIIAAVVTYGPALLRIVALGPISLAYTFAGCEPRPPIFRGRLPS